MTTPVCTIDAAGIHKPDYDTIRAYVVDSYKAIYGDDVYVAADSQDGQLLSLFAQAIHDCNAMAVAVYNSFSPSKGQGEGLSSNVKINGITRNTATYSTVDLRVVGEVGTIIEGGVAADDTGVRWILPATVTIPLAGEITVTATAKDIGAIDARANTIKTIATPTRGWQTVNNPAAATPGAPVETDAALKRRQAISTSIPATTPLEAMIGAIADLTGVQKVSGIENDTSATDINGVPSHSVALVVDGGTDSAIAQIIARKKTVGTGTYGSTAVQVADNAGVLRTIRFSRPTQVVVLADITIKALPGYSSARATAIKQAIVDWLNTHTMGEDVIYTRMFLPANLGGQVALGAFTFEVLSMQIGRVMGALGTSDIPIAFNEAPLGVISNINVTVVS